MKVPDGKLTSWKEIAFYLKCDESTARRWEQKNHLPVHRVGGRGGSVFAYAHEIDCWLKEQNPIGPTSPVTELGRSEPALEPANNGLPEAILVPNVAEPLQPPSVWSGGGFHRIQVYGLVCFVAAIVVAGVFWLRPHLWQRKVAASVSSGQSRLGAADGTKMSDAVPEDTAFELKKLVKESQIWEMLTLYAEPWTCDAKELHYWAPGSKALLDVVQSVSRLNERDLHYGFGAKLLDFEFRFIRIARDGSSAEVGTREHWWLPVVSRDGTVVASRNPDQGPYEIEYLLVKLDGRWYLKSTSTPYTGWKPKQITCKNWSG